MRSTCKFPSSYSNYCFRTTVFQFECFVRPKEVDFDNIHCISIAFAHSKFNHSFKIDIKVFLNTPIKLIFVFYISGNTRHVQLLYIAILLPLSTVMSYL
ncbi:uncharacterized protein Smp_201670 [Schistosoma mansoni]|uniref:Smp_201670 n=1 Tax=Schistosoma mansoni TaxID=6183 RepID=G4VDF8_SCHMA|nr:uncharacterized protein Smp_201670 [Schistosoma mansoni]|eukprot:XP_018649570.1 uncharacterized protein Smp_201670 [Schistosoma mansoni]